MSRMYGRNRCGTSVQERTRFHLRTRLTASGRRNFFTVCNGGEWVQRISFTVNLFAYVDMGPIYIEFIFQLAQLR
jgi:hypothetical protein